MKLLLTIIVLSGLYMGCATTNTADNNLSPLQKKNAEIFAREAKQQKLNKLDLDSTSYMVESMVPPIKKASGKSSGGVEYQEFSVKLIKVGDQTDGPGCIQYDDEMTTDFKEYIKGYLGELQNTPIYSGVDVTVVGATPMVKYDYLFKTKAEDGSDVTYNLQNITAKVNGMTLTCSWIVNGYANTFQRFFKTMIETAQSKMNYNDPEKVDATVININGENIGYGLTEMYLGDGVETIVSTSEMFIPRSKTDIAHTFSSDSEVFKNGVLTQKEFIELSDGKYNLNLSLVKKNKIYQVSGTYKGQKVSYKFPKLKDMHYSGSMFLTAKQKAKLETLKVGQVYTYDYYNPSVAVSKPIKISTEVLEKNSKGIKVKSSLADTMTVESLVKKGHITNSSLKMGRMTIQMDSKGSKGL